MPQGVLSLRGALGSVLIVAGLLSLIAPDELAMRANRLSEAPAQNLFLIYAFGVGLIATGVAIFTELRRETTAADPRVLALICAFMVLHFILLTLHLQDWWIDDAGITFAYSRSLAEGLGLVAQPWLPPEEGYSSSVWMLMLAAMGSFGADIPLAAKYLGTGFSALGIGLCAWLLSREVKSPLAALLCGFGIASAPTVTWAASGQEHALQGLLLLAVVVCVYRFERWRWPVALILSVFVLTRPEAPIIVIAVFFAAVLLTRRAGGKLVNTGDLSVALIPFMTFLALIAFRWAYFGDPLPNPYYAKSEGTGLFGVLNPLGGGWAYILNGLRDTALLILLGLVFLIRRLPLPAWLVIAVAILVGQAFFVIWAKGDWMRQYRFLMPILPIAVLVATLGLDGLRTSGLRVVFGVVAALILLQTTMMELARFKMRPTTPMAVVVKVGDEFRALADRLGIEDPVLAHHDAGGISYHRRIRLVDLGGLVNRTIAQNMHDKAFLTTHLLEDVRPDFFFGGRNFATATGFAETDAFENGYVRLDFPDQPEMSAYLTHIRRDRVRAVPGVTPVHDDAGAFISVRVDPADANGG